MTGDSSLASPPHSNPACAIDLEGTSPGKAATQASKQPPLDTNNLSLQEASCKQHSCYSCYSCWRRTVQALPLVQVAGPPHRPRSSDAFAYATLSAFGGPSLRRTSCTPGRRGGLIHVSPQHSSFSSGSEVALGRDCRVRMFQTIREPAKQQHQPHGMCAQWPTRLHVHHQKSTLACLAHSPGLLLPACCTMDLECS